MYDQERTIKDFLHAASAKQPTPGGGSVTALVGALSASMGEMVINYSVGKKELQAYVEELTPALEELTRARKLLMQLMVEDQMAYDAVASLRKLPPDSPERAQKMPAAMLARIRAPESIAATGVAILEICDRVANFVNPRLLSDLAVCSDLAMATTRCAIYNVRTNLTELTDPADRSVIESTISGMLTRAASLIQRVAPRIWERHRLVAGG